MNTTLSIDKEIRNKAYQRAKADKISLSAVARMLLLDYAEWRISIWARFNDDNDLVELDNTEVNNELLELKEVVLKKDKSLFTNI